MTLNNEAAMVPFDTTHYSFFADGLGHIKLPWLRSNSDSAVVVREHVRPDQPRQDIVLPNATVTAWRDDRRQGWHIVPCGVRYAVVKGAPYGQAFAAFTSEKGARDAFRNAYNASLSRTWYAYDWHENWGVIDLHNLGRVTKDYHVAFGLSEPTGPTAAAIVEAYAAAQRADKRTGVWTFDGSGELVLLVEGIEVPMARVQTLWAEALAAKRSATAKQERNQIVCEGDLPCQLLGQDTNDILKSS